ncbi:MAG: serine/threonine-protein kinase [Candidatus Dormibacteraceae bacterium]
MLSSTAGAGIGPGSRLGSYVIEEKIGQGAMGLVYRGRHQDLDRPVAVKVLQSLTPEAEAVPRFRREAQAISRLRHPNILTLYDYGEVGSTPYMIIEYLPRGTLAEQLAGGARPDRAEALRILEEVGAALDHAHSKGIVHRDVKPANVLIAADGSAVLADFGLARLMQSSARTASGISVGTPYYMAPEQATGAEVGAAADRYALATVAYELLAGRRPFDGDEVLKVLYAKVHADPEPPSAGDPDLPLAVDAVILRGLSRDPAARWPTCQEMIRALGMALVSVAPTMLLPRSVPAPAAGPSAPMAARPRTPRRGRSRRLPGRLIAAGVAVLALAGTWVLIHHASGAPTLKGQAGRPGSLVAYSASHLQMGLRVHFFVDGVPIGGATVDPSGQVHESFRIPLRQPPGQYTVEGCWSGSCPLRGTLQVTAGAS